MGSELGAVLAILALGVVIVLAFQRLGVSALVAYLVTGVVAGPSVLGLVSGASLAPIAHVGAAMLLFSIGLELDLGEVRRRLRATLVASLTQISLTLVVGALIGHLAGLSMPYAVAVGACLTMTSSIVLMRALEERKLRARDEGQLSLSVALMQDVALGPLLLLIALLAPVHEKPDVGVLGLGIVLFTAGTLLLRRAMASRLVARMRASKLPELEVAFAITIALGAAGLAEHLGLGAATGAFAAGLSLGGRGSREAMESSTRSLTGLSAILFFAAMGALFDVGFVVDHWLEVGALALVAVVVKAPLAAVAMRLAGMPWRRAWGCGLLLAQVGEFAFVLAAGAFGKSSDPALQHLNQLVIATTCISLASAPLLAWLAQPFLPAANLAGMRMTGDTVVVAGLGPVGNTVVDTLRKSGVPLLLIDRNDRLLAPWEGVVGVRIHRGRIEDMEDWMPLIGHRPPLVVLTFPVADASAVVARRLRSLDPNLRIIARAPFTAQVQLLFDAGAHEVICDEAETARALMPMLERILATVPGQSNRLRTTNATMPAVDSPA
jgi:monovalent cation:H+ antiporter-2, CPA2 family